MKVLLVESDPAFGVVIHDALTAEYPEIAMETVPDCPGAMRCLNFKSYDLVLLDIASPCNESLVCLAAIRKDFPLTAVVVISGLIPEALRQDVLKAGADEYSVKHAVAATLPHVVWSAIERRRNALLTKDKVRKLQDELRGVMHV
jgi:DNA-binding response OmpR family regulator